MDGRDSGVGRSGDDGEPVALARDGEVATWHADGNNTARAGVMQVVEELDVTNACALGLRRAPNTACASSAVGGISSHT